MKIRQNPLLRFFPWFKIIQFLLYPVCITLIWGGGCYFFIGGKPLEKIVTPSASTPPLGYNKLIKTKKNIECKINDFMVTHDNPKIDQQKMFQIFW